VTHHGLRHVLSAIPGQAEAETQIDVFVVAKKLLVESADLQERIAPIKRGRCTRSKDLIARRRSFHTMSVIAPPGEPADVVDVARSVDALGIVGTEQPATKERELRRLGGRLQKIC
jgi:hypothetical protein